MTYNGVQIFDAARLVDAIMLVGVFVFGIAYAVAMNQVARYARLEDGWGVFTWLLFVMVIFLLFLMAYGLLTALAVIEMS